MKPRFTIDGDDGLEKHLERTCHRVEKSVRQIVPGGKIDTLMLGGGYGRGQGGVLKTDSGDKPYNDLEFYVCLRGNELLNQREYHRAFHELSEHLSPEAGVEVEFKISSAQKLQQFPPTMFSYDLAWGHQTLIGDDTDFVRKAAVDGSKIPMFEATRLLMNRCSGLLFAKEHLQRKPFTAEDADFVGRNHAKAQLGFGDVFLTAHGLYHWNCLERNRRLNSFAPEHALPWLNEVRQHHKAGVEFKLHPQRTAASMDFLCDQQRALTHLALKIWLWLESTRLNRLFVTARDYAFCDLNKCPETNPIRNFFVNAKTFGSAFLLAGNPWRYPRERLLNTLALLMWESNVLSDFGLQKRLVKLHLDGNFSELVRAYETLWRKFN